MTIQKGAQRGGPHMEGWDNSINGNLGRAQRSGSTLLDSARALFPQIRAAADTAEHGRRVTPEIVQTLRDAGIIRMTMPTALGGAEIDPVTQIKVIEELSRADGSVGWFAMIGSDGGYYSAFLAERAVQELYGEDLDAITAGFTDPAGRAEVVDGGYLVSGKWPFASGCEYASWLASGCNVIDRRCPTSSKDRRLSWRVMMLPAEGCSIVDSWHTTGLRGTGSHHYVTDQIFVPDRHAFSFLEPPRRPNPLYAFPTMFRANMAGVPLGIAQAAIDTVQSIILEGSSRTCTRDDPLIQAGLARARGLIDAARTFVLHVVDDIWIALCNGIEPSQEQRACFRLGLVTAFNSSREAVDLLYRLGGGMSVYTEHLLDRYLRDIVTACQHVVALPKSYVSIGKMLLGLDADDLLF